MSAVNNWWRKLFALEVKEIFVLPMPSSWLSSPEFKPGLGRSNTIRCEWLEYEKCESKENENPKITQITRVDLIFSKCWGIKITHYVAIDAKWIPLAYGKVVDLGATGWLRNIRSNIAANRIETGQLRHLMICFDDGPLFEFICESFEVEQNILQGDASE